MKSTSVYKFHHAVYWRKVCGVEVFGSAQQGSNVYPLFSASFCWNLNRAPVMLVVYGSQGGSYGHIMEIKGG